MPGLFGRGGPLTPFPKKANEVLGRFRHDVALDFCDSAKMCPSHLVALFLWHVGFFHKEFHARIHKCKGLAKYFAATISLTKGDIGKFLEDLLFDVETMPNGKRERVRVDYDSVFPSPQMSPKALRQREKYVKWSNLLKSSKTVLMLPQQIEEMDWSQPFPSVSHRT